MESSANLSELAATRSGPFWDVMAGKREPPPVAKLLGFRLLDINPDAGTIRIEFHASQEFLNPMGNVQGGILCAMLDDTMGPALVAKLPSGQFAPTLELKTSFIAPAKLGKIIGEGRVVHLGKSIGFVEARLSDGNGKLLASATATVRIVNVEI